MASVFDTLESLLGEAVRISRKDSRDASPEVRSARTHTLAIALENCLQRSSDIEAILPQLEEISRSELFLNPVPAEAIPRLANHQAIEVRLRLCERFAKDLCSETPSFSVLVETISRAYGLAKIESEKHSAMFFPKWLTARGAAAEAGIRTLPRAPKKESR